MTVIYYFSRTGKCEDLAQTVATQTGGTIHRISDGKNWNGLWGWLKAGYYASSKKKIPASYEKPQAHDRIYLCFPLWAGAFPPAVRSFIDEVGRQSITVVVSSLGSTLTDREGFAQVIDVVGKNNTVTL